MTREERRAMRIIQHYEKGRYTNEQMKVFVKVKQITKEQYKETTGIEYTEQ